MDKIEKRVEKLSFLEKIGAVIPGFIRYARRGKRREADRLLRESISSMLKEQEHRLGSLCEVLAKEDKMDLLRRVNSIQKKIAKAADRVRYATYGASGLFDLSQVGKQELDKLYKFDAELVEEVEQIKDIIEEIVKMGNEKSGEIAKYLREIGGIIDDFNSLFSSRKKILLEE
ncbi:hypothetical protein KKC91_03070 [bacterium]|nr:hypothetical protein [bacterium]